MDKIVKFVIGFIVIGTIVHFVVNDDPLNFDWAFECKKTLATVNGRYDICLIDCPPSLSILTINALRAAYGVIIPTQPQIEQPYQYDQ